MFTTIRQTMKRILSEKKNELLHYLESYLPIKKPHLAHQGIQRSGTNYLSVLLKKRGYFVVNRTDPKRNHPAHKHFRWQKNKDGILLDRQYVNKLIADNIGELNKLSGHRSATKHVIIFKEPKAWLCSINRWAVENNWESYYSTKKNVWLKNVFLEWDAYYAVWQHYQEDTPSQVLIINFEDLINNNRPVLRKVDNFMELENHGGEELFEMSSVPKSPMGLRINLKQDILDYQAFCEGGEFEWRSYLLDPISSD